MHIHFSYSNRNSWCTEATDSKYKIYSWTAYFSCRNRARFSHPHSTVRCQWQLDILRQSGRNANFSEIRKRRKWQQ